ncbi:MAG: response regulator [Ignavibacteria bacterium]|nr:response regulator [Ignavibacteria bacterium]
MLLIEDDEMTVEFMTVVLSEQWNVLAARSGPEAWTILRADRVDIILMDISLAGRQTGIELTVKIRRALRTVSSRSSPSPRTPTPAIARTAWMPAATISSANPSAAASCWKRWSGCSHGERVPMRPTETGQLGWLLSNHEVWYQQV